jgi:catalase
VLTDTSRTTPVFLRFSTVQGSRGSADTVRDVRGFAVKFYTDEGNWDIVGNDIPVFFIQESIKFPDIVHAVKPEPHTEVPTAQSAHNNFWDFVYLHKEATHMYHWNMSDRGIPRSYRMMQGFGVNTYSLVNDKGERSFVKFHFTPELGVHSFVWDEALKLAGQDPDFHRKDLYEAIDNGAPPKWKFGIQVLKESQQDDFDFDILDATKVWPEEQVPVRYIGELELNRNVDEYFTETEQVAFCTSHIVPGIDFSADPLLQGRNFSYFDTQLSRLGINWQELPINRPVCPYLNFNRDGQGRHTITKGEVNYWPNRFEANPPANHTGTKGAFQSYPAVESGMKARMLTDKWKDYLSQAQLFYNSLSAIEKLHLTNAFSFELDHCDDPVVYQRLVDRLTEVDLSLAQAVAEKCGAPTPTEAKAKNHGKKAKGLSQLEFPAFYPTIKSRRIAILIADGYDHKTYSAIVKAIQAASALPFTIAPKRQKVKSSDGNETQPSHHFNGMRSTMFDAVVVPGGEQSIKTLTGIGLARFWVREAFGHDKAIAAEGEGIKLVEAAISEAQGYKLANVQGDAQVTEWYGVITAAKPDISESVKIAQESKGFLEQFFWQINNHRCWARELDGYAEMVSI